MRHLLSALLFAASVGVCRAAPPADPLASPMWTDMVERLLGGGNVVFDDAVKVVVPPIVEDQAQVPVTADARAIAGAVKVVVFADLNPIQHVLTLTPGTAAAYVSFRMKVEQGTPIRAAVLTKDGVWHVGGVFLDAAGGGCSAPAKGRGTESWSTTLGETQGRIWHQADGWARVRLRIRHPMDTGLALDNTPAYFIERLSLHSDSSAPLAELDLYQPVSEDPMLTFLVRLPEGSTGVDVQGRDTNGLEYRARIPANEERGSLRRSDGGAP